MNHVELLERYETEQAKVDACASCQALDRPRMDVSRVDRELLTGEEWGVIYDALLGALRRHWQAEHPDYLPALEAASVCAPGVSR